MFALKKIVSAFLLPLPFCLLVAAIGLALLWFTRRQRTGKVITTVAFVLLTAVSIGPAAHLLVSALENRHPPLLAGATTADDARAAGLADVRWIVVLGGGHTFDPRLPATGQLSPPAVERLVEAMRLRRLLPDARLILSGAGEGPSHAAVLARAARALGVDGRDPVQVPQPRDTEEEAAAISRVVGQDRFVLVTSAAHMPRAVALFRNQGANPIPSPTDYSTGRSAGGTSPVPGAGNLRMSESADHEYLGLLWSRLRGKI